MQLADHNVSMITNVGYKSILTLVYDTDIYHLSSPVLHDEGLVLSLVLFYLLLHLLHINAISKVEDCIRDIRRSHNIDTFSYNNFYALF